MLSIKKLITCKLVIRKKLVYNKNLNKKVVFIILILSPTTVFNRMLYFPMWIRIEIKLPDYISSKVFKRKFWVILLNCQLGEIIETFDKNQTGGYLIFHYVP